MDYNKVENFAFWTVMVGMGMQLLKINKENHIRLSY